MNKILPPAFYDRKTEIVARELLGKFLVRLSGKRKQITKIVETEAYLGPFDLAAHSRFGNTARTAVMFGPPGRAYVYLIYGMYYCLNIVTEAVGSGSAVLIRAVEPVEGVDGKTSGPGLLCRALGIDKSLNGADVTIAGPLYLEDAKELSPEKIVSAPRVGVDYSGLWKDKLLRFYIKDNPFVSRRISGTLSAKMKADEKNNQKRI